MRRQRALFSAPRTQHMQPVAIFARARVRGASIYAALSCSAPHLQLEQIVRAARAMATAAVRA